MGYCTAAEVYNATTLDNTIVPENTVNLFIKSAEKVADRFTFTTYWALQSSGDVTSATDNTLTSNDQVWTSNQFRDMYVWIYAGTGAGQVRKIASNTATALTVDRDWFTNPDTDSKFRVFYTASNPNVEAHLDGTGTRSLFLLEYPIQILESLSITGISVNPESVYLYKDLGKIELSDSSERLYFDSSKPQRVAINYWFGVDHLPEEVKRYAVVNAALSVLSAQMGGTYNVPSTYQLPEGSVTIGQAYVNIRGTFDVLMKEKAALEQVLRKYPVLE